MQSSAGPSPSRRTLLLAGAASLLAGRMARAETIHGKLPWHPNAGDPPVQVTPGPWQFFTPEEGAVVEAIADRIIPPDEKWAGGREAGCAVFIDRQLAGPYGRAEGLYMRPPFWTGTKQQGPQSPLTPSQHWQQGLAALAQYVSGAFAGKSFATLSADQQDDVLHRLESGEAKLGGGVNGGEFMKLVIDMTKQGFLTDPVYGGNRGMIGWRMIGFPGAVYDYRDWISHHNETWPHPPVAIGGSHA